MISLIARLIYFMLPAYAANTAPVFTKHILKSWKAPLDFGMKFRGKRIFGEHKTWKGLLFGAAAGVLVAFLQSMVDTNLAIIDYSNWLFAGFLLGFGALFGDAVKSFFKRRLDIPPGESWIPFDQIDYSLGAIVFVSPWFFPGFLNSIIIIIISFLLHVLFTYSGFRLGLRERKW